MPAFTFFFVLHAKLSCEPPQLRRHPRKQGRKAKGDVAGAEARGKDGRVTVIVIRASPQKK
jgi:hypothetical protein